MVLEECFIGQIVQETGGDIGHIVGIALVKDPPDDYSGYTRGFWCAKVKWADGISEDNEPEIVDLLDLEPVTDLTRIVKIDVVNSFSGGNK